MSDFIQGLKTSLNHKLTENGADALRSTLNPIVDLFGMIGAMRERSDYEIIDCFEKAYESDPLRAMKLLFYARDIREGLGERKTFRVLLKHLATTHTEDLRVNLRLISEFGRWDDLYSLLATPLEKDVLDILSDQFRKDLRDYEAGKRISLLAKWLPSVGTKSQRQLALKVCKHFGMSERNYRKAVSSLRKHLDVVEVKMSANDWDKIVYDQVPSKAASNYRESFRRHDEGRYNSYLQDLVNGKAKVNAGAIYPYEIAEKYLKSKDYISKDDIEDPLLEEQWKALPNFVTNDKKFLIMADSSGSMYGRPMNIASSLAIYFSDRTKGYFHNYFMTFSSKPELVQLRDSMSFLTKLKKVYESDWGGSTNLEGAFETVLNAAISAKLDQSEMPDSLVVITDMEIDRSLKQSEASNFTQAMRERFEAAGYSMPTIVWWNVNARSNTFHAEAKDSGVRFISGSAATAFKSLCENMGEDSLSLVLNTLDSERYSAISIA